MAIGRPACPFFQRYIYLTLTPDGFQWYAKELGESTRRNHEDHGYALLTPINSTNLLRWHGIGQ